MPIALEERVETLESILGQFIIHTDVALRRLEKEMKEFKDEMKEFKDEMKEFKNEMKEFKNEMKEFKNEMNAEVKKMNKQWGNLANKMGTIVEDIISPAVKPVIKKYFNCESYYFAVNVKKQIKDLKDEFDVLSVCEDKVFVVEVKSNPKSEHVFVFKEKLARFKKLFPEYKDKKIIPVFGSLRFGEDVINLASKEGIYILGYREWEYMDILNFDKIK